MDPPPPPITVEPHRGITLIRAGAVAGFAGPGEYARPGAVVAEAGRVVAAGPTPDVERRYGADAAEVIDLPDRLMLPGLINAHAHLELTAIGPQPYGGDFVGWVKMLREHWPGDGEPFSKEADEGWFARAAGRGASLSKAAGVQAVGDITRFGAVVRAQREAGLVGTGFIELFGLGPPWDEPALQRLREPAEGFQPHAPYSAGPDVFAAACATGRPVCCHLAETLDEAEFIAEADGPFRKLFGQIGKWSDKHASPYRRGLSPVRWMEPYLRRTPWLVAHCNYVSDDDIALLAETGASVAYCPIASEYFAHTGHRYRDMLDAGVNVCLGTDSIVCQPPGEPQPLGILPQMRRLFRRDGTDPALLLRMATMHGRRALALDDTATRLAAVVFDPQESTDPLAQVLRLDHPVRALEFEIPLEENA